MSKQWYGSLTNRISERAVKGQPQPEIGMGATITHYTDRSAGTVTAIIEKSGVICVQEDNAIRIDNNGMSESQDYRFERNPQGRTYYYRKDKNGIWRQVSFNEKTKRWNQEEGAGLRLGERDAYHDYSF